MQNVSNHLCDPCRFDRAEHNKIAVFVETASTQRARRADIALGDEEEHGAHLQRQQYDRPEGPDLQEPRGRAGESERRHLRFLRSFLSPRTHCYYIIFCFVFSLNFHIIIKF